MKQAQLEPLETFVRQSLTLLEAYAYLLQCQLVARRNEHDDLAKAYEDLQLKVSEDYPDPTIYFLSRLFVSQVSGFELFLQDIATAVVLKNPKKVGGTTFSLSDVLDAANPEMLVRRAIDEWLNKLMYKRPAEYLKDLTAALSIEDEPLQEKWRLFIEAKARRDVGVHNNWKCNAIYLRKTAEIGVSPDAKVGELLIPTADYFRATNNTLIELAVAIFSPVIAKHWPGTDINKLNLNFGVVDA